jgi:hypothetical protein
MQRYFSAAQNKMIRDFKVWRLVLDIETWNLEQELRYWRSFMLKWAAGRLWGDYGFRKMTITPYFDRNLSPLA